MLLKFIVLCLLFLSQFSLAGDSTPYELFLRDSAARNSIPYCMLRAVLIQEGGTVGMDTTHDNGSTDTGVMQFNKDGEWMRWLAKNVGITYESLKNNPGVAIAAAAFVIRKEADRKGGEVIYGVSAYHRGASNYNDRLGTNYLNSVRQKLEILIDSGECESQREPTTTTSNTKPVYITPADYLSLPNE